MNDPEKLKQAIAVLEAQRAILGDAVVDIGVSSIRKQLAELEPVPQRKQVTILFADVSGFTAMSETMDAEDVNEVMNALWDRLDKLILSHHGTIDKHIGDAVMAIWGATVAREDDAEQAIRAALAMQTALAEFHQEKQVNLGMRIGINTGQVVWGEVGTVGEQSVIGDAVNTASRLEHAAPVGSVLISHDTYQHVRGIFDVVLQAPLKVRGKAEPLLVYLVEQAKPRAFRIGRRGVEGIATRMVGRTDEMSRLQTAFQTVARCHESQMITLLGDAGLGKSRLLDEFTYWVDLQPETIFYFKGRARLETQGLPYALLRDLLFYRWQIQESDTLEEVWQKMAVELQAVWVDEEEARPRMAILGQWLGLNPAHPQTERLDNARELYDRALSYLSDYFKSAAAINPVVILLEDIHWADDSSLNVFNDLVRRLHAFPVLFLAGARSTLLERRADWGNDPVLHQTIKLEPLAAADSQALVSDMLQKVNHIPADLRDLLIQHSEGNPFYLEELIKMFIEDGVIHKEETRWRIEMGRLAQIRVPATITAVLQARLDHLPAAERDILQRASVIGRVFWDGAIHHLVADDKMNLGPTLTALTRREMIFPHEASTLAGTAEHIFKHAILHQVTYESVLKKMRRTYHALVAEWLMTQNQERQAEVLALIADHLEQAGEVKKAVAYLQKTGEQAAAQYAHSEAVAAYSRALNLIPPEEIEEWFTVRLGRAKTYHLSARRQEQWADLAHLEQHLDSLPANETGASLKIETLRQMATYFLNTGHYDTAIAYARIINTLGETDNRQEDKAWAILMEGMGQYQQGHYLEAQESFTRSLSLARSIGSRRAEADALRGLGNTLLGQQKYEEAKTILQASLVLSREGRDLAAESLILNSLGIIHYEQGQFLAAQRYYREALHWLQKIAHPFGQCMALNNLGNTSFLLGDIAAATDYYQQCIVLSQEVNFPNALGSAYNNLGAILRQTGQPQKARTHLQQALTIGQKIGYTVLMGVAETGLGHAAVALGQLAQAESQYQQAITFLAGAELNHLRLEATAGLAYVALLRGDAQEAHTLLAEVMTYLAEQGTIGFEEPLLVLHHCYQVLKTHEDERAGEVLRQANQLMHNQLAQMENEAIRQQFVAQMPLYGRVWEELVGT